MKRYIIALATTAALAGCGNSGPNGPNGGNGTPSVGQVKSDLTSLMLDKGLQGTVGDCVHQNGNQFICAISGNNNATSVNVTDDGKTIFEQGL